RVRDSRARQLLVLVASAQIYGQAARQVNVVLNEEVVIVGVELEQRWTKRLLIARPPLLVRETEIGDEIRESVVVVGTAFEAEVVLDVGHTIEIATEFNDVAPFRNTHGVGKLPATLIREC